MFVHSALVAYVHECTCVAQACAYTFNVSLCVHIHVTLIAYACMHTAACA